MNVADHYVENQREMSEQILGNLSTAIVLLDTRLIVLYINQAAESLLQVSYAKVRDRCFIDLLANGQEVQDTLNDALTDNQSYTRRKFTLLLPGKENVTVDLTVTPVDRVPGSEQGQQLLIED